MCEFGYGNEGRIGDLDQKLNGGNDRLFIGSIANYIEFFFVYFWTVGIRASRQRTLRKEQ